MRIEFQDLEQRPGTHTVPVKMTREELEDTAQKMSEFTTRIEAREESLKSYTKEMRDEIKEYEQKRSAANRTFRMQREPKTVAGLWGFDFKDNGKVRCKTCVERVEKGDDNSDYATQAAAGADEAQALADTHATADHPFLSVWERPLGTKWFVVPEKGDVFGPVAVTEKDLQKELPAPATTEIAPFAIAFDVDSAIPLLNEAEVSSAQKKLKETEAGIDRTQDDTTQACPQCGLPLLDHPDGSQDGDPCVAAMKVNATRLAQEQEKRTDSKYGSDVVLNPDDTYNCAECNTPTFGKDLQPVQTADGQKFVCFACEHKVGRGAPAAEEQPEKPKKKRRSKKDKGGADASA